MLYQLGWTTLPGLRGLSCSEFRATPTLASDCDSGGREAVDQSGVAVEFASEAERDAFVWQLEGFFAARRFTNTADAFDTVKAYALEHAGK
jgi:hypothetical protein